MPQPTSFDYERLIAEAESVGRTDWPAIMSALNSAEFEAIGLGAADISEIAPDVHQRTYNNGATYHTYNPTLSGTGANTGTAINSNVGTQNRGVVSYAVDAVKRDAKASFRLTPSPSGGVVFAATAGTAAALAATGIQLGKAIDSSLYNANPDFWESIGASTLNPDTWSTITAHDDSLGADLFNFLFDINPETGEAQAYLQKEAFEYLATALSVSGVLTPEYRQYNPGETLHINSLMAPLDFFDWFVNSYLYTWYPSVTQSAADAIAQLRNRVATNPSTDISYMSATLWKDRTSGNSTYLAFNSSASPGEGGSIVISSTGFVQWWYIGTVRGYCYGAESPRRLGGSSYIAGSGGYQNVMFSGLQITESEQTMVIRATSVNYSSGALPDASGAIVVNPDRMQTIPDTETYLPTTYPEIYQNPLTQTTIDPETGEEQQRVFLPIPLPNLSSLLDALPTSGTSTQQEPEVRPDTTTEPSAKTLAELLQGLLTATTNIVPVNPPDTGTGTTPVAPAPTGSASALWSIYNPTQAQVDALGAWLWSPNFVDQILKIFNNPMESIIGLHKVFAAPAVGGAQNIKVGYLDSGVSSNVVTSQYATVDCGTVSLLEQFGSVFDYSPYTDVKLYLPFVGIVPLDVADVMRSTLGVVYHVDVLTGACLAEVTVTRDGGGGTLYQYAGDAAVQYPISSGSYMGIVAGIAGAVGSIAATAATGGGALPMILGAGGSLAGMHTTVQNSGGFGGNAGAMGAKKPYLIISRPQTKVAADYPHMQGYPTNHTARVGECSGYIRAAEVRELDVPATSVELAEIADWLMEGVIL